MSLKVYTHPRTGTHYTLALLNENFFHHSHYMALFGRHLPNGMKGKPREVVSRNPNRKHIYLKRKAEDVLKSVFALRSRFGLAVDSFSEFLETSYREMWKPGRAVNILQNLGKGEVKRTGVGDFFRGNPLTPLKYYEFHQGMWDFQASNLLVLQYEEALSDLNIFLNRVARFLDLPPRENYINITQKVGWYNEEERELRRG